FGFLSSSSLISTGAFLFCAASRPSGLRPRIDKPRNKPMTFLIGRPPSERNLAVRWCSWGVYGMGPGTARKNAPGDSTIPPPPAYRVRRAHLRCLLGAASPRDGLGGFARACQSLESGNAGTLSRPLGAGIAKNQPPSSLASAAAFSPVGVPECFLAAS